MAQQYLIDINLNDDLQDAIRKVNHNFKVVGSAQRKQTQIALRAESGSIRDDLGGAIADAQDLAQDAYDLAEDAMDAVESANDYEILINKPEIEGNVLIGDQTFAALGMERMTNNEIDALIASADS